MYAAIWLPHFHLQAAMRGQAVRKNAPAALLDGDNLTDKEKAVLREANAAAVRHGIHAGMTAPQAQARCAYLHFVHPAPREEEAARRQVLECAAAFTPNYEYGLPGLCVLDLTRVRHLAGREMEMARQALQNLSHHRLDARVGFAPHADLAMLAAQAAEPVLILRADAEAAAFLHALPLAALRPPAPIAEVLYLWGVHTVGQFVKLPRVDVAARLGAEGVLLWEIASGSRERLLDLVRLPRHFQARVEVENAIECLEPLLFLLRRLLDRLCLQLAENWLVAAAIRLGLRFADHTEHRADLRIAEPSRDVELLARVLHTHLEGLQTAAPIVSLALQLQPIRPARTQADLFSRGMRDPNGFAETLAHLEALLGTGNIGKARLLPSWRQDAFVLDHYLTPRAAVAQAPVEGGADHGLLLRRFRPRQEVRVNLDQERPAVIQTAQATLTVTQASGPWLLSGEWWNEDAWQREIWEVAADDGSLYQLACESGRWVLDGVYG